MMGALCYLEETFRKMKLYELPRNSFFTLEDPEVIYKLDHIDGMYSVCYTSEGDIIHLAAYTEVKPIDKRK